MTFKQIFSHEKEHLTKKEMLLEMGYNDFAADQISRKLKKEQIRDAWITAYNDGDSFYAVEKIKKALAG